MVLPKKKLFPHIYSPYIYPAMNMKEKKEEEKETTIFKS